MTRYFVSFIRLVVVVVVSFGTIVLAGCGKSPTSPSDPPGGGSGGSGITMPPPGGPQLTEVPSDWVQFETYDGQPFPAKARVLYLSPEPGSRIIRGVAQNCAQFSNTCFQRKFEVCIDLNQYTRPGSTDDGFFNAYFSNERGGLGPRTSTGYTVSGPDTNGCWVYEHTWESTNGGFNPFPDPGFSDCCQWINVTVSPAVHRIGEEPNWDNEQPLAYAPFFLYYQ